LIPALFFGVAPLILQGCATQAKKSGHEHDHDAHGDHAGHDHGEEVVFRDDMDVRVISEKGEAVDIEPNLVQGKVTIIDFGAEWCGPCKDVDALLFDLLDVHDDLAVRKIDVGDWESEVAKTHLKNIPQLPYVQVYGPDGKKVDAISGLDLKRLKAAIEKARERKGQS
jgi:thiol-disulfide isomerase/thioredoxin